MSTRHILLLTKIQKEMIMIVWKLYPINNQYPNIIEYSGTIDPYSPHSLHQVYHTYFTFNKNSKRNDNDTLEIILQLILIL